MRGRILTALINKNNTKLCVKAEAQFKEVIMKNRSRIALLIVVLFVLGTGTIAAYQSLSKTVAIIDDGKVTQYETFDIYVGELLDNHGIILGKNDTVMPSEDSEVVNGMKITIKRWKPTVKVTINAKDTSTFETTAETVEDVIKLKKIELSSEDEVTPSLATKITDELEIAIKTKEVETKTVEEEIPFETETKMTTELNAGASKVITEGQTGLKQKTVEIVRFGGEVISQTIKEENIKVKPINKVVEKGIANTVVHKQTGTMYEYTKVLTFEATAYTDVEGDSWAGITATGAATCEGIVAVDPKVIPLGTKLYIEGYGVAIAGDTGGAIKGHKIDLFFNSLDEVYTFGRRDKKVYILKDQSLDVFKERS